MKRRSPSGNTRKHPIFPSLTGFGTIETKETPVTLAEMENRPASFDFFPESQRLKIRAISHIDCDFGDFPEPHSGVPTQAKMATDH
jgi:hypothetical protein